MLIINAFQAQNGESIMEWRFLFHFLGPFIAINISSSLLVCTHITSIMEHTQTLSQESLKSQAVIWDGLFGFVDSMALKSAVELRIADIIHSHGRPITLSQLAASLESPTSPDIPYLFRIMRSLVRKEIFTFHHPSDGGDALYGLTEASKWLLHGSQFSLAPMVIMENHPWQLAPWHYLSACVREGGIAFEKAHGCEMWDFASKNAAFNKIFNDALACTSKFITEALLREYRDGFTNIETLVDVGGGTGGAMAEIVKSYPHIKGINFDLVPLIPSEYSVLSLVFSLSSPAFLSLRVC